MIKYTMLYIKYFVSFLENVINILCDSYFSVPIFTGTKSFLFKWTTIKCHSINQKLFIIIYILYLIIVII